jgi:glycosyltransferase involved in cell wall biosynthesis
MHVFDSRLLFTCGFKSPIIRHCRSRLHEEKAKKNYRPDIAMAQEEGETVLTHPMRMVCASSRGRVAVSMGCLSLSVVIITLNEEANLLRTLASVSWADEIVVLDSGSTDRTREIAESRQAKVFVEPWKGFAAQKNSALEKATGDWILSLDADEEVEPELANEMQQALAGNPFVAGFWIPRKNFFLKRWIRHGGFYPDPKLRLFRRGTGHFEDRLVHEDLHVQGPTATLTNHLLHHAYPTLDSYLEHMNRYSSLGAQMAAGNHNRPRFSFIDIVIRPRLTFFYNYFVRGGFLDGREGLLLHLYHADYVSWKYAKAWERKSDKLELG